jgi:hypothetical protein
MVANLLLPSPEESIQPEAQRRSDSTNKVGETGVEPQLKPDIHESDHTTDVTTEFV